MGKRMLNREIVGETHASPDWPIPRHSVHYVPYIHARYQGEEAAIAIEDGSVFDGGLGVGCQWRGAFPNRTLAVR